MKSFKLGLALLAALVLVFAAGCSDESGTSDYKILSDGWIVYTANGLQEWATAVESNSSLNCTLGADIDMEDATWTPITEYNGTFDGDGHKVSNFNINSESTEVGFFGRIDRGTIKGLGLENVTVTGLVYVGGIAGYNLDSTIIACYFTGSVKSETNAAYAGGIAGRNASSATITACYYTNADDGVGTDLASSADATEVDGSDIKWAEGDNSAMNKMNTQLQTDEVDWRFEENTDTSTKDNMPLVLTDNI